MMGPPVMVERFWRFQSLFDPWSFALIEHLKELKSIINLIFLITFQKPLQP